MAAPGIRFGPYELVEPIGKGGMGEVYRARDATLDRDVAVKILPESLINDSEYVARFEREAKMLASLNHYNIANIFGFEQGEQGTALIMELVEGPTLADRIAQGPLPLDETVDIAGQIARALEAAHERGIIHRDLKPANVKLRPDGVVKVLDFGLAKTVEKKNGTGEQAPALTTPALTEVGTILGTAAYMSPEQARGKALDQRADIWAFGAVLYEMLTGQPAFLGEDTTETVASVLKTEPNWAALPALPAQLEAMLRQCLVKDPKNRVHDVADVRLALDGAYRWTPVEPGANGGVPGGQRHGFGRVGWIASAVAGLFAGIAVMSFWPEEPAVPVEPAAVIAPPQLTQLTFRHGRVEGAQFAADGQVLYAAAWDDEPSYRLYQTTPGSFQSREIADLPPAALLGLSDDDELALALAQATGTGFEPRGVLARVDRDGGSPRNRFENVTGADWGPVGEIAALARVRDGESELEFPLGEVVHRSRTIVSPRVSPDGSQVCFAADWDEIWVANKDGSKALLGDGLLRAASCGWSPDGSEIWFSYAPDGATFANIEAIRPDGTDRRVLYAMPSWGVIEDVGPDGGVLISAGPLRYSVHAFSPESGRELDLTAFDASLLVHLSAIGGKVVVRDNSVGTGTQGADVVYIDSIAGSARQEIGTVNALAITSDGDKLALLGTTEELVVASSTITLEPTGVGAREQIELAVTVHQTAGNPYGTNDWEIRYPEFSDDGSRLLLPYAYADGEEPRVYVHDFNDGTTRAITPPGITGPVVLSPDGRSVASNEQAGLVVYDVDTGQTRIVPGGRDPGVLARWSSDDDFVYLIRYRAISAEVWRRSLATGESERVKTIAPPDPAGIMRFYVWLARDGESYAYSVQRGLQDLFLIQNIR